MRIAELTISDMKSEIKKAKKDVERIKLAMEELEKYSHDERMYNLEVIMLKKHYQYLEYLIECITIEMKYPELNDIMKNILGSRK